MLLGKTSSFSTLFVFWVLQMVINTVLFLRSKEVITGPAEYCVEKKSHAATWTRDPPSSATESSTNEKYRTHHCYRIPASCAAVKPVKAASWKEGDAVKAPTVVCQEGWKMSDADKVEWRDEWDW